MTSNTEATAWMRATRDETRKIKTGDVIVERGVMLLVVGTFGFFQGLSLFTDETLKYPECVIEVRELGAPVPCSSG